MHRKKHIDQFLNITGGFRKSLYWTSGHFCPNFVCGFFTCSLQSFLGTYVTNDELLSTCMLEICTVLT